jgi:hypothetical protein
MAATTEAEKAMYVALVCRSMTEGLTARKACIQHGVNFSNLRFWCGENPDYAAQYAHAREVLYEHWEEDIIDISDETQTGEIRTQDQNGFKIEQRDMIQHRTLRVHSRQWLLSKLKARKFGDKLALGGADDLPPIQSKADVTLAPEDAYKQMIGIGGNGRS